MPFIYIHVFAVFLNTHARRTRDGEIWKTGSAITSIREDKQREDGRGERERKRESVYVCVKRIERVGKSGDRRHADRQRNRDRETDIESQ